MKELAGRLSALDPEASDTLKVIAYFDTLVHGRVGAEGMLRGAAVLSGATVGHRLTGSAAGRRVAPDGTSLEPGTPDEWAAAVADDGSIVWIERIGAPHANDAMLLERLAMAMSILSVRLDTNAPTRRAVETLVAADASDDEREEAMARLALSGRVPVHAVAIPATAEMGPHVAHATIATRFGLVRAALVLGDEVLARPAGVGTAAHSAAEVRGSWRAALLALRLTDDEQPVVRADDLGPLLLFVDAEDQRPAPHADVDAVGRALAAHWTESLLRDFAAGASQRTLAAKAGVHHSTMGARLRELAPTLGFDPATPLGRTRLQLALMLSRLAHTRFDRAD